MNPTNNTLYYGDNLDILRRYLEDESVDLIYLDPPFNSNADYNVLFAEKDGAQAHAQIRAFEDTWSWDLEAAAEYAAVLRSGHDLRGVIEREEAAIGVFIALEAPTAPMRKEAAEAGFFQTKSIANTRHPRTPSTPTAHSNSRTSPLAATPSPAPGPSAGTHSRRRWF
jgi:hypothetical protein